jgi:hypothetical protein
MQYKTHNYDETSDKVRNVGQNMQEGSTEVKTITKCSTTEGST